jgi:alkaline phosphatase
MMRERGKIIQNFFAVLFFFVFIGTLFAQETKEQLPLMPLKSKAKNIILFIGDGMGLAHIAATRIKTYGVEKSLYMERMPITGYLYTSPANTLVTDSAAAGTALATGYKTNVGRLALSPEGKRLPTILEACKSMGMSTGMVVTYPITNATPAAFASHVRSRKMEEEIAVQILRNRVNVLLGGGKHWFIPQSTQNSKRTDNRDLIAESKNMGYSFVETKEELLNAKTEYLLGLFEMGSLAESPNPSLAEMTQKALELLSRNPKGFFLMVEGSQIDWGGHINNINFAIRQTIHFDEAVKIGLDFALKDQETLVIVTADHETGGLGITDGSLDGEKMETGWLSKGHTAIPVIIFAFGPGAERFTGVGHLTDVPRKISDIVDIKNFPLESPTKK